MDPEVGKWIVIAFATVGAAVWLAGLWFMIGATRERQARAMEAAQRFEIEETAAAGTIVGEAEVAGQPEELSAKLASLLARGNGTVRPDQDRRLRPSRTGLRSGWNDNRRIRTYAVRRRPPRPLPADPIGIADPCRICDRGANRTNPPRPRLVVRTPGPGGAPGRVCDHVHLHPAQSESERPRTGISDGAGGPFPLAAVLVGLPLPPARSVRPRGSKHWCITCPIPDGQARVSDEVRTTLEARSYLTRRFRPGGHESKGRRCRWSQRLHGRAVETLYSSISSGSAQSSRFRFSKTCAAEATTTMTSASG